MLNGKFCFWLLCASLGINSKKTKNKQKKLCENFQFDIEYQARLGSGPSGHRTYTEFCLVYQDTLVHPKMFSDWKERYAFLLPFNVVENNLGWRKGYVYPNTYPHSVSETFPMMLNSLISFMLNTFDNYSETL